MNPRATLALLVLTLLTVGGIFYLRSTVPDSRERAETERYAMVFDPDEITAIEIQRGNDTIILQRDAAAWRITSPAPDRASPEAVERLLVAARFLEVRDRARVQDGTLLNESGLKTPRVRLHLRGPRDLQLDLGSDSTVPGQIFARLGGGEAVLRVPATILELVSAPGDSFRDPRLTDLVSDDIDKFTVRRADGEMTVRRERTGWIIEKPVKTAADPRAVASFLESLLGLRVTGFAPALADPGGPGTLPGQTAGLALTTRGGGEVAMEFTRGTPTAEGTETLTARFAPRGGTLDVDPAGLALFDVSPEALRDRTLGHVDADTVDRIVITSGVRTLTIARNGDDWITRETSAPVDAARVTALIEAFNATRVEAFRPPTDAPQTGLNPPSASIAFYAWLSENSAEDAAGGHLLASTDLGSPASDVTVYARTDREGEIVTVNDNLGAQLRELIPPPPPEGN